MAIDDYMHERSMLQADLMNELIGSTRFYITTKKQMDAINTLIDDIILMEVTTEDTIQTFISAFKDNPTEQDTTNVKRIVYLYEANIK